MPYCVQDDVQKPLETEWNGDARFPDVHDNIWICIIVRVDHNAGQLLFVIKISPQIISWMLLNKLKRQVEQ